MENHTQLSQLLRGKKSKQTIGDGKDAVVTDHRPHKGSRSVIFADGGYPKGAGHEVGGTTADGVRPLKIVPSHANY